MGFADEFSAALAGSPEDPSAAAGGGPREAKELLAREGVKRKAGGQEGHLGAGRELVPEDQVDEIVAHYPRACRGCGREFSEDERRAVGRFGRHQVCGLPPISVMLIEHRTHRLRCPDCSSRTTASLPAGVAGPAFGPRLRAAIVTLTARNRISRRGIAELAGELFGARLPTGSVDGICQHASTALSAPHSALRDWILAQDAVHVDETGWRTAGDSRALWTAATPGASIFEIAEHCNREQFNELIGDYAGIVISDRWNGYEHLDPDRRQVCWSGSSGTSVATQKDPPSRTSSASKATSSPAKSSKHGAPTNTSTTTASAYKPRSRRSKPSYASCSNKHRPRAGAPAGTDDSRTTCSKSGPRSGPSPPTRRRADQQSRRTRPPRTGDPPKTLARNPQPRRRAVRRTRTLRRRDLPPTTTLPERSKRKRSGLNARRTPARPRPRSPAVRSAHPPGVTSPFVPHPTMPTPNGTNMPKLSGAQHTTLLRIPDAPYSVARHRTRPMTACLETLHGVDLGEPRTPASELIATNAPPPFLSINGTACRATSIVPVRFTAKARCQSPRSMSVTLP